MDGSIYIDFIIIFGACFIACFLAAGIIMGFWLAILNSMLHFGKDMMMQRIELAKHESKERIDSARP